MNSFLAVAVVVTLLAVFVNVEADKSHREAWKAWKAELDKLPFADKLHECMKAKRAESGGGEHKGGRKAWREKWENMTEEEREEAKKKMEERRKDPEHQKKFAEFRTKMHKNFEECWTQSGGTGSPPEPPKFGHSN
ncbi:hypothetical protein WR25_26484 [Diploscapter pachys]|uniref:HMG box domain-containing protein n=1 Tax=Diploscapter pachys TaxID=2018661 RepID=A0A2A2KRL2_9BILA|nr:hypothetical protein WR25_26484 [Diploscapter pachys]